MKHSYFISAVMAMAIAVAGFTAAPARASNDTAVIIAGATALAIIGSKAAKSKKKQHGHVNRNYYYGHKPYKYHKSKRYYSPRKSRRSRGHYSRYRY